MAEHRYNIDTDRCICGGIVVYFEDPDDHGRCGEGCERYGVWPREKHDRNRSEG